MDNGRTKIIKRPVVEDPKWRKLIVESELPEKLKPLKEISMNLWWVWNEDAKDMFELIEPDKWCCCNQNPIALLEDVSYERLLELQNDKGFLAKMDSVYEKFCNYLEKRKEHVGPQIAYFSMEFGLHDSLKIYSGGLGVLAGDYLKEASDFNVNMIGIGLLYRYGYFKQVISHVGEQIAHYDAEHFSRIPVTPILDEDGEWITIKVDMPGREVIARLWQVAVGGTKLILLDTDIEGNHDADRAITHHLYGGDNENRLKQEMILGIGGIRALRAIGFNAELYHCNEGHAAFIGLERIWEYIRDENLTFTEAKEVVRASTLFTTHTPVPAGHDAFHVSMINQYLHKFEGRFGIYWEDFLMLGKAEAHEDHFNMSYLASHLSQEINGVSMLHGDVSKDLLAPLYKGYMSDELDNIGYVTNGVHYPTWAAEEWKKVHTKYFGDISDISLEDYDEEKALETWSNIKKVPDSEIWSVKTDLKKKLIKYTKQRYANIYTQRHENPKLINEALSKLNPKALTIGFARRFATYKRANLLFRDLNRLAKIVNDANRPVQFIFAGKAHPADRMGQDLIKRIVEISKQPEFIGKVLFIPNYDMGLAKQLLQGVDVWLNTPTRPLEASGTSGEKGIMNGTIHFSVLDGWWVEGYKKDAGWALPLERSFDIQDYQDELDAEIIYSTLENEIVPTYYENNSDGIPEKWISYVKNTFSDVAPRFTTRRMMKDYYVRFYNPLFERYTKVKANNFMLAKDISVWKAKISENWSNIEVIDMKLSNGMSHAYKSGQPYPAHIQLDLNGLKPEEVGVEILVSSNGMNGKTEVVQRVEFLPQKAEGDKVTYSLDLTLMKPGSYNYALRLFPKNKNLPHRQDFRYVRWI